MTVIFLSIRSAFLFSSYLDALSINPTQHAKSATLVMSLIMKENVRSVLPNLEIAVLPTVLMVHVSSVAMVSTGVTLIASETKSMVA